MDKSGSLPLKPEFTIAKIGKVIEARDPRDVSAEGVVEVEIISKPSRRNSSDDSPCTEGDLDLDLKFTNRGNIEPVVIISQWSTRDYSLDPDAYVVKKLELHSNID